MAQQFEYDREGFGDCQWINFGKYKRKTVYDVANEGDYDYLRYLKRVEKKPKATFYLSKEFIEHLNCALTTMASPQSKWDKECTNNKDGSCSILYVTMIDNEKVQSPEVKLVKCSLCDKLSYINRINQDTGICRRCYQTQRSVTPELPSIYTAKNTGAFKFKKYQK